MSEQHLDLSNAAQELVAMIDTQPSAVVSRGLVNKPAGSVTLFAFDVGEGLSEHSAPYDALAHVLEGEAGIRIASHEHAVNAGCIILLPANVPHACQRQLELPSNDN